MKISFKEYLKVSMFSIIEILILFVFLSIMYKVLDISQTNQTIQDYFLGSLVCYIIIELNIVKYKLDKLHNELDR